MKFSYEESCKQMSRRRCSYEDNRRIWWSGEVESNETRRKKKRVKRNHDSRAKSRRMDEGRSKKIKEGAEMGKLRRCIRHEANNPTITVMHELTLAISKRHAALQRKDGWGEGWCRRRPYYCLLWQEKSKTNREEKIMSTGNCLKQTGEKNSKYGNISSSQGILMLLCLETCKCRQWDVEKGRLLCAISFFSPQPPPLSANSRKYTNSV